MKEILLSKYGKNKGKYVALVDDEDYERVNKLNWYIKIRKSNNLYYAVRQFAHNNKMKCQFMHSYILGLPMIDHKDHNGLNNQRLNLRECTTIQNCQNQRISLNGSSIYKGVNWNNYSKKWVSQIGVNYRRIFIGRFKDEIEAAKAYDAKAKELFGEFAFVNFK